MKNLIKSLTLVSLLILSCSSESEDENNEMDNGGQQTIKLLKSVTYANYFLGSSTDEQLNFYYEDGVLKKYSDSRSEILWELEYEGDQINEVKFCYGFQNGMDLETTSCDNSFQSETYVYENDRLIRIQDNQFGDFEIISYNPDGTIKSETCSSDFCEEVFYEYDSNGNISSMTLSYQGESNIITYEYDGKQNPFNIFWREFGFKMDDLDFEPYDLVSCLFKHNATKVYSGTNLSMEATYTYDTDGYPLRAEFIKYNYNMEPRESVVIFTYE